jgi:hypothetical protein
MPLQSTRSYFDGMRPAEAEVFRKWLKLYEHEYDTFEYNVRVGPGTDPGPLYSQEVRRAAILSSQRRIDAVGWRGTSPTIIEVKHFATRQAIEQISLYGRLWVAYRPHDEPAALLIVAVRAEPGFSEGAAGANIGVHLVA